MLELMVCCRNACDHELLYTTEVKREAHNPFHYKEMTDNPTLQVTASGLACLFKTITVF